MMIQSDAGKMIRRRNAMTHNPMGGMMTSSERQLEEQLIQKLRDLKFDHRPDIRDRAVCRR
jgi:hypothetical protein